MAAVAKAIVKIETNASDFRKVRSVNSTDNGFPSRVPVGTRPTGDGSSAAQATSSAIIETGLNTGLAQNSIMVVPYGVGNDNTTFSLRVIGWNKVAEPSDRNQDIWIPVVLCELAITLSGTPVGLANKTVDENQKFADTISVTTGNSNVSTEAVSPTGDVIAHAVVDIKGFQLVELTFNTGSSATSCNALWKLQ